VEVAHSGWRLARGADAAKDQSYVLYVLGQEQLARTLLPVGDLTKDQVRAEADRLGLRTATKPDSQDVCFITSTSGRSGFLRRRLDFHPGRVVDAAGTEVGTVDAVELVTVGQRRGLGLPGGGASRYAVSVDVPTRTVRVGAARDLDVTEVALGTMVWPTGTVSGPVLAQCSAHGIARPATLHPDPTDPTQATVRFETPSRRVAPGQSVVLYDPRNEEVLAGGLATG
jgi:tRNA-specific 2-thiouridylase